MTTKLTIQHYEDSTKVRPLVIYSFSTIAQDLHTKQTTSKLKSRDISL